MQYHMMVECRERGAIGVYHWRPYTVVTVAPVDTDTFEGRLKLAHQAGEIARNERFIGAGGFETSWETRGVYRVGEE